MEVLIKLFTDIRVLVTLTVISILTIFIGYLNLYKHTYKYNVCSNVGCYYTNKYSSTDNNCITFKSNFDGIVTVCGSYRIYLMN